MKMAENIRDAAASISPTGAHNPRADLAVAKQESVIILHK